MSTKQQEQLLSQMNANVVNNSDSTTNGKLFDIEELIGTPFSIVGNEDQGYCLVLGQHRLTDFYPYKYDVEKCLSEKQWDIITMLIIILTKKIKEEQ